MEIAVFAYIRYIILRSVGLAIIFFYNLAAMEIYLNVAFSIFFGGYTWTLDSCWISF